MAKGGQERTIELDDDRLVTAVRPLKRARHGNPRLLVYRDSSGYHEIDADPPATKKALNAAVQEMLDEVSDHLGNTPTVARASYVDPRVVEQYERGRTIASAVDRVSRDQTVD